MEAWTALHTRVMKTLLYAVPAMSITSGQNAHIMAPILMSSLNAIGIQRYLPRSVVYAPLQYQGLAVPNLYVESGIQHVVLLLQETHGLTQTGKLLILSLEAMKVEIGVGGSVLTQSFSRYGCLATRSWVKNTWQFLAEHNMTIADQVGDLALRRQGDSYLMEAFTRHGISGPRLQQLNTCRLFLQVDTLSDITTADGRYITWHAQHGRCDDTRPSSHKWPSQPDPGSGVWKEWQ
jgi:hypothetical protein